MLLVPVIPHTPFSYIEKKSGNVHLAVTILLNLIVTPSLASIASWRPLESLLPVATLPVFLSIILISFPFSTI